MIIRKTLTFQQVCALLINAKIKGNKATARCPSHDDKRNSLSITETSEKILLCCHAGCTFGEICDALDITPAQLFSTSNGNSKNANGIEAIYEYHDENGKLLHQVVRLPGKNFYNRKPSTNGDWENNLTGVRRVLYRLPRLKAAQSSEQKQTVYICEGEKDVETLEEHGFLATCNPHGAGKWRDEYNELLTDLHCTILPDNDELGRTHAEQVANSILDTAASVRVLDLPNLPEKGDISDWFQRGHTPEELKTIVEKTSLWAFNGNPEPRTTSTGFRFTALADLLLEPDEDVAFILEKTLPVGGLSIIAAKPKVGKTTTAQNLAYCISEGLSFLGRQTLKGKVLYLSFEEKREEVKKHFASMGAKGENILIHTGAAPENTIKALASAIAEYSPVLVIIDPLSRVLRVSDFNEYGSVARALEPVIDMARKFGTHILATHHAGKGEREGGDSVLGSTALFGAVDCLIQMKEGNRGRTISTINRYGENLPETVILLDKDTGLISVKGDLETITQVEKQNDVLANIADGEELTEPDIKERVGGSRGRIAKAIRVLVEEGKLIQTGKGKRGNPYLYSKPDSLEK